ncbi:hypothetical protein J1605_012890 [Eschrichtius robustus]|uniref:Uncharacterized protein n=1 Tax=Eschrichtius robustus TaxID=9764 RepID=A0AB34GHD4_ESCRO|nr:hypothetical protein J1605_012890 [Eschrichtius robustus]
MGPSSLVPTSPTGYKGHRNFCLVLLGFLGLGKASHHVVRTLKLLYGEAHVERNLQQSTPTGLPHACRSVCPSALSVRTGTRPWVRKRESCGVKSETDPCGPRARGGPRKGRTLQMGGWCFQHAANLRGLKVVPSSSPPRARES